MNLSELAECDIRQDGVPPDSSRSQEDRFLLRHLRIGGSLNNFHEAFAVQLNDTHPSIGVAELMRLLGAMLGLERINHRRRNERMRKESQCS